MAPTRPSRRKDATRPSPGKPPVAGVNAIPVAPQTGLREDQHNTNATGTHHGGAFASIPFGIKTVSQYQGGSPARKTGFTNRNGTHPATGVNATPVAFVSHTGPRDFTMNGNHPTNSCNGTHQASSSHNNPSSFQTGPSTQRGRDTGKPHSSKPSGMPRRGQRPQRSSNRTRRPNVLRVQGKVRISRDNDSTKRPKGAKARPKSSKFKLIKNLPNMHLSDITFRRFGRPSIKNAVIRLIQADLASADLANKKLIQETAARARKYADEVIGNAPDNLLFSQLFDEHPVGPRTLHEKYRPQCPCTGSDLPFRIKDNEGIPPPDISADVQISFACGHLQSGYSTRCLWYDIPPEIIEEMIRLQFHQHRSREEFYALDRDMKQGHPLAEKYSIMLKETCDLCIARDTHKRAKLVRLRGRDDTTKVEQVPFVALPVAPARMTLAPRYQWDSTEVNIWAAKAKAALAEARRAEEEEAALMQAMIEIENARAAESSDDATEADADMADADDGHHYAGPDAGPDADADAVIDDESEESEEE